MRARLAEIGRVSTGIYIKMAAFLSFTVHSLKIAAFSCLLVLTNTMQKIFNI